MRVRYNYAAWLVICVLCGWMAVLTSCRNNSAPDPLPEPIKFKAPVVEPLLLSKPKKIDWASIKTVKVLPAVKNFDLNKLPVKSYASSDFKPFTHPVEKVKVDFNSLPEKDLDIDKLPSKPLKFKQYKLPAPRLVAKGRMRLKDTALSMYELDKTLGFHDMKGPISIMIDHNGFLWMGTSQAIYRYDGENIKLYVTGIAGRYIKQMFEDADRRIWVLTLDDGLYVVDPIAGILSKTSVSMGLGSQNCVQVVLDRQKRIWISGYSPGGLNIIDTKTQTVKWLDHTAGLSGLNEANGLMLDNHGNMWVATWRGLNIIDFKNKKVKYFDRPHGMRSDSINRLMQDGKGNIYMGTHHGLISILNAQKDTLQTISEPPAPKIYSYGTDILDIMQDDEGRIWVTTNDNGVMAIDPEKQTVLHLLQNYSTGENFVKTATRDGNDQVWIASQTGLYMIGNRKAILEHITNSPTTTIAEDREGLAWQGTFYNGVNVIDRKNKIIRTFDAAHGLLNDTMTNFRLVGDRLFVGNMKGVDIIDRSEHYVTQLSKEKGLSNRMIDAFVSDRQGRLWLGGTDNGIDVYDEHAGTLKHLGKKEGLKDLAILDMHLDGQGRIWISTVSGGIHVIDPGAGVIQYLSNLPLTVNDQRVLQPDNAGNVWIGTGTGAYVANIDNKTLTFVSTAQGLIDDGIISLLWHKDRLYAGTTKGISVITSPKNISSGKDLQIVSYGLNKTQQGYATDQITSDGLYLWGDAGLTVLDLSKSDLEKLRPYIAGVNIMDDLQYFTGKSYRVSNGASWDGVQGTDNLPVNLTLPYDQNYVQFQYGTINLSARDTTWYAYKLIGKDQNWSVKTTSTSSKNYFNLSPGDYTFEVTTLGPDNAWMPAAILSFTIKPPWWRTWWAYLLYTVLLAGSIWGFSYYRSIKLIREKRILEHKVHVRTEEVLQQKEEIATQRDNLEQAFEELKTTQTQLVQREKMASLGELTAGIAHEIQNPLNFVNNFSDVNREMIDELQQELKSGNIEEALAIAGDLKDNEEKISHHGKRADGIVKGMLEHSRTSTGQKEPTDLNKLADEYLRLSYHGLRAKDKSFNAEMITHFDEALPKANMVSQDIGRVLLNIINNAFYAVNQKTKTAGPEYKPSVEISTAQQNGSVSISVKDNGSGIPENIREKIMQPFFTTKPTGEGTGLGLSLSYDIVVKGHGGKISVDSKEDEGSEFIVTLPV